MSQAAVFDRDIEITSGGARIIPHDVPVAAVEDNCLLLKMAPWSSLEPLFGLTFRINPKA